MRVIQCGAGLADVSAPARGVCEIRYRGVLTRPTFERMRADVLQAVSDAGALVLRMDRALMAIGQLEVGAPDEYGHNPAPGAVVVNRDQVEFWADYSSQIARKGVMRAVFLDSQLELARHWAVRHARAHAAREEWPLSQRYMPLCA